jgi:hypothetical protein
VESKNDELFLRTVVDHLNIKNIQVDNRPICHIHDYQCLEGLNLNKLVLRFEALKNALPKRDIQSVGVILDHDGKKNERFKLINDAIQIVFDSEQLIEDTSQFINISARHGANTYDFKLSCFLVNVQEKGELETLLKTIKTKPSVYADCLYKWVECVKNYFDSEIENKNDKIISDKDFDKFWLSNYIRFDTCTSYEKKQVFRKCSLYNFDYVLLNKKDIFDFDHPVLDTLKRYLYFVSNSNN